MNYCLIFCSSEKKFTSNAGEEILNWVESNFQRAWSKGNCKTYFERDREGEREREREGEREMR